MPAPSILTVSPVKSRGDLKDWLSVPRRLYSGWPNWVAPLDMVERKRVSRHKHPFFKHADVELFVARLGAEPVGRISAQIDRAYLAQHNNATGHFGFFDSTNDQAVANALFAAAGSYVAAHGMNRLAGPYNFSTNEECGVLVDGFDSPPAVMMPQSPTWQAPLIEAAGFIGEMDLYAYRISPSAHPEMAEWLTRFKDSTITVRDFNSWKLDEELALAVDLFNDAWSENWGFVPFTIEHMKFLFQDFRLFFRSHYGKFVYVDGEPAAFVIVMPNLYEIMQNFRGKLLPFNWLKMAFTLAAERTRTVRIPLFGITRKFQRSPRAAGIVASFMGVALPQAWRYDIDWFEMSWILASNKPLVTMFDRKLGQRSKTYRLYAKALS
jgi:hypothetical protein